MGGACWGERCASGLLGPPRSHYQNMNSFFHFPLCLRDSWCSLSASQQLCELQITNLALYINDLLKVTKREEGMAENGNQAAGRPPAWRSSEDAGRRASGWGSGPPSASGEAAPKWWGRRRRRQLRPRPFRPPPSFFLRPPRPGGRGGDATQPPT